MSVPAFVAAVQQRSADGVRAALSPRFQGKANGKPIDADAQVRLLEAFWQGFPAAAFAMEPTGGSGRYVITWTFAGAHDGPYLGVPPTGKPVSFSGYIVAVADATGVLALDWKWDTKVFAKSVLGPDDVGDLEVKDTFRDPSRKWAQGNPRRGDGHRRKPKGPRPGGQRAPQAPRVGPDGQPLPAQQAVPAVPGQPGQPGQGKRRRRRGKGAGPKPDGAPDDAPMTPSAPMPDTGGGGDATPSSSSAPSADASGAAPPAAAAPDKPDGA